jgi:hypothetical protein
LEDIYSFLNNSITFISSNGFGISYRTEDFIEEEDFRRNYINGATDHVSIDASNLVVWGLGSIPLCILCAYIKLTIFPHSLFSYLLIPQYVFTIALIVGPILTMCTRGIFCSGMDGDDNWRIADYGYVITLHIIVVAFNLLVSIQVGLIGAKLDQLAFVSTKWSLLFLPIWFIAASFICMCPVGCCLAMASENEDEKDVVLFSTASVACFVPCLILPMQLGAILVALMLDHVLIGYYSVVFLPFMISTCLGTCCVACCCCCCFTNKLFSYTDDG